MTGLEGAAPAALDVADLAVRLLIDLVAIAALAYGLYYRRHGRRDLFTVYSAFNVGVFLVVTAITVGAIAVAVGFGLFAVLAMIRLRSEPFSHPEFAYFFLALVVALVCGVDLGSVPLTAALCAIALATAAVVDHSRILRPARSLEITLEAVFADEAPLRAHLEERLAARVVDVAVLEIDYVREITRVRVSCQDRPAPAPAPAPGPRPTHACPSQRLRRRRRSLSSCGPSAWRRSPPRRPRCSSASTASTSSPSRPWRASPSGCAPPTAP